MLIKFLTDKRPLVKASINGIEAILLVDTGSSITMLDISKKKKFNLKIGRISGQTVGLNGDPEDVYLANGNDVVFSNTFHYYQWIAGNMESSKNSIKNATGYEIDGIIGWNMIKDLELVIYSDKYIQIGYNKDELQILK